MVDLNSIRERIGYPTGDKTLKATYSSELIALYTAFKERVHPAREVLYPCSATDASPARVFNHVTFVDIDDYCMTALRAEGLDAITGDIQHYTPREEHDLLILLNPSISSFVATPKLKRGGWIIANDYHGNARELYRATNYFEFWGTADIKTKSPGEYDTLFSRDAEGLFIPVVDEKELKKLRPDKWDFISKIYPHMLTSSGIDTTDMTFREIYETQQKLLGASTELPSKRIADHYIFRKK